MSQSNCRTKEPETLHHLTSRMAHRVFFLKEDQRNDFMSMLLRVAVFTGVRLIGWCVMENHFHIFAHLPTTPILTDEEVIARFQEFRGCPGADVERYEFSSWRKQGEAGAARIRAAVARIRRRMYSIAWFMRIIKQWFSEEYNRREGHKGTLWEGVYHDRVISDLFSQEARDCLAYIHLNPVRAAITPEFAGYCWSSLHDAFVFDQEGLSDFARLRCRLAMEGIRFVYGAEGDSPDGPSDNEIRDAHIMRMNELLEHDKLERAEEIVRMRAAGMTPRTDALTDEAMVAQAHASVVRMQQAAVDLHAEREIATRPSERKELLIREIRAIVEAYPDMEVGEIAVLVQKPIRTVYRYLKMARSV